MRLRFLVWAFVNAMLSWGLGRRSPPKTLYLAQRSGEAAALGQNIRFSEGLQPRVLFG
jgi:hypothetical protein